jgi:hypothetical protein
MVDGMTVVAEIQPGCGNDAALHYYNLHTGSGQAHAALFVRMRMRDPVLSVSGK